MEKELNNASPSWQSLELKTDRMTDIEECKIHGTLERADIQEVHVVGDNKLLLLDLYNNAECIDTLTGETLWRVDKIWRITVVDGRIYCREKSVNIAAFDSDGKKLWTQNVSDTISDITVRNGFLFTHTYSNAICVDIETGKALWRTKLNANTGLSAGLAGNNAYMIPYKTKKGGKQVIGFLNARTGAIEKELPVADDLGYDYGFTDGNVAWWTPGRYCKGFIMVDTETRTELPAKLNLDNAGDITEEWIADMRCHNGKNLAVVVVKNSEGGLAVRVCEFRGNDFETVCPNVGSTGAMAYNSNELCILNNFNKYIDVFELSTGDRRRISIATGGRDMIDTIAACDGSVFAIQKGEKGCGNIIYAIR